MIRVLPTLPRFRYTYTCPRCGCHVVSHLAASGGWGAPYLRICSSCGWVHSNWRRGPYRRRGDDGVAPPIETVLFD
jgi:predicted RNA-binding Zn-ribbon protein involved in translation (DUF1610 family)